MEPFADMWVPSVRTIKHSIKGPVNVCWDLNLTHQLQAKMHFEILGTSMTPLDKCRDHWYSFYFEDPNEK